MMSEQDAEPIPSATQTWRVRDGQITTNERPDIGVTAMFTGASEQLAALTAEAERLGFRPGPVW